jgi:hypothetical protein
MQQIEISEQCDFVISQPSAFQRLTDSLKLVVFNIAFIQKNLFNKPFLTWLFPVLQRIKLLLEYYNRFYLRILFNVYYLISVFFRT